MGATAEGKKELLAVADGAAAISCLRADRAEATVRLRTEKTKGSGSRIACLTMVFKLTMSAQKRWRALNGASTLLAAVIQGVKFEDGIKKEAA
jgi:hypothetical protein